VQLRHPIAPRRRVAFVENHVIAAARRNFALDLRAQYLARLLEVAPSRACSRRFAALRCSPRRAAIHRSAPSVSTSNGMTIAGTGREQGGASSSNARWRGLSCSRSARAAGSANTSARSAGRFRPPSSPSTPAPKRARSGRAALARHHDFARQQSCDYGTPRPEQPARGFTACEPPVRPRETPPAHGRMLSRIVGTSPGNGRRALPNISISQPAIARNPERNGRGARASDRQHHDTRHRADDRGDQDGGQQASSAEPGADRREQLEVRRNPCPRAGDEL